MAYTALPVGFLAQTHRRILTYADEPLTTQKWTASEVYPLVRNSMQMHVEDVNHTATNPIVVRYPLAMVAGTAQYLLPHNVGQVLRVGLAMTSGGYYDFDLPRGRLNPLGCGWQIIENVIEFEPAPATTQDAVVEYIPNGDFHAHLSTFTQASSGLTASVVPLDTTPDEGYFDSRPNAYLGMVFRLLAKTGSAPSGYVVMPVQERIITGYSALTNRITVSPALDFNPASTAGTYTYEIVPILADALQDAVVWDVVAAIMGMQADDRTKVLKQKAALDAMRRCRSTLKFDRILRQSRSFSVRTDSPRALW